MKQKDIAMVGRVVNCDFPALKVTNVPCKVDTGADLSSIWASDVRVDKNGLSCVFFGPLSPFYSGEKAHFSNNSFSLTRVSSSFGNKQLRYKVKIKIHIDNRVVNATFTLADRSNKLYPVLLGRRLLRNKFIVNVAQGTPLVQAEKLRRRKLSEDMSKLKGE